MVAHDTQFQFSFAGGGPTKGALHAAVPPPLLILEALVCLLHWRSSSSRPPPAPRSTTTGPSSPRPGAFPSLPEVSVATARQVTPWTGNAAVFRALGSPGRAAWGVLGLAVLLSVVAASSGLAQVAASFAHRSKNSPKFVCSCRDF